MPTVELNQPVPDFEAPATGDQTVRLADLRGKNVVIYFYPKDNTPGCTTEGQDFRDRIAAFEALDTVIFGVSRDGLKAHENFRAKYEFPFHLISDQDETLCRLFDVIKLKKLYGKEYMGIDRSTFLIDRDGVLRKEWRGVKVKGHADEVLEAVKAL
ncbi:peroxiredoxin [Marinobacter lutaoensis]|jgi:peroxiredoxin Q/BCP|uniref:thioredoxin-dependent peroxiredoxin n=1 Tax=Marinobacter lutaoensis TaxID=135739 RepID=A0A1V2DY95_9GAMM|nr:peroxiredoxin [Marinobacter lutaoensis]MBE02207.1 peroxiredoxin [Marinobacter sp.]MBI42522.1 peroxiredoxin [Oceanospirillales bacterium]NVD36708.1 peroxiredoxin [Marinobacter lutaoensis]ONF45400.1 peroxiredoxin [Marinobacter lutaoensis]|tara:strand:- start:69 stop:536 length:468 start_codon:yes stop_codon:yes gene_type:complete